MATDSLFHWARIQTSGRNFQVLAEQLEASALPALAKMGGRKWMLANGLFGLWTNELILVTVWPNDAQPAAALEATLPAGARIVEQRELLATARPLTDDSPTRPGVYVHRLFGVDAADIDRFVALSAEAWETFETTGEYTAEPQGLFRLRDHPATGGQMLLVTWYDRLESWERSRTPPPEAEANFRQRALLTKVSVAYATRIIGTPGAPRAMGG